MDTETRRLLAERSAKEKELRDLDAIVADDGVWRHREAGRRDELLCELAALARIPEVVAYAVVRRRAALRRMRAWFS